MMPLEDARSLQAAGLVADAEELYRRAITAGRFDQAEAGYRQALTSIEGATGGGGGGGARPEAATIHRILPEFARARGRYADAESHARTALRIRKTAVGA